MRTKGAKDKTSRSMGVLDFSLFDVKYWEGVLNMVEKDLYDYVNSKEVAKAIKNKRTTNEIKRTPEQVVALGMKYFRFSLEHRQGLSVGLLSRWIFGMEGNYTTLLKMEQRTTGVQPYVCGVYKPIVRTFKDLIVAYHELIGGRKINPSMPIFQLKSMRGGYEEKIEIESSAPEGLTEEERTALRKKIRGFSEK